MKISYVHSSRKGCPLAPACGRIPPTLLTRLYAAQRENLRLFTFVAKARQRTHRFIGLESLNTMWPATSAVTQKNGLRHAQNFFVKLCIMSLRIFTERRFDVQSVKSLAWDGDSVVDWASGGHRYSIDGVVEDRRVNYAYPFDASIVSPSGRYAAIFVSTGTKGLLLRDGQIIRQLNRDFYHAHAYLYPIAFARLPGGREVLIHCPDKYCQIEIEDAETGDLLTKGGERNSQDVFHSRLSVSSDGRWLMSAGWVWHPVDVVHMYNLQEVMQDPHLLDGDGITPPGMWEISSAAFVDAHTIAVGTSDEFYGDDDDKNADQLGKNSIAFWTVGTPSYSATVELSHSPGTIMPVGDRFAISMFDHPRLIDLDKGQAIHEWEDIDSGKQKSSITWDNLPPPMALDSRNARFAIAQDDTIRIITVNVEAL